MKVELVHHGTEAMVGRESPPYAYNANTLIQVGVPPWLMLCGNRSTGDVPRSLVHHGTSKAWTTPGRRPNQVLGTGSSILL